MGSSLNSPTEDTSSERWQNNILSWCLHTIAASRALIGLCILISLVLSLRQLQGPPVYRVQALLIQNSEPASSLRSTGSTSALSVVLGGSVASLPEIDEFQILLPSPEVAAILDKKYGLLHDIFRDNWDAKNSRWHPLGWRDRLHAQLVTVLGGVPVTPDLNYYDLAKFLGNNISLTHSAFSSVMQLQMYSDRPDDARRWLDIILYEVSDVIRSEMIAERQNYVNYLQQQLSQSALTTSRDAIITILADQYRALMVLKSAKAYPLQQIQPPTRDQFPVNKSISLIAMYGILGGLMLAGVLIACGIRDATIWRVFSRYILRRQK